MVGAQSPFPFAMWRINRSKSNKPRQRNVSMPLSKVQTSVSGSLLCSIFGQNPRTVSTLLSRFQLQLTSKEELRFLFFRGIRTGSRYFNWLVGCSRVDWLIEKYAQVMSNVMTSTSDGWRLTRVESIALHFLIYLSVGTNISRFGYF